MHDLFDPKRDVVWVDSVSMMKLVKLFGLNAEYRAGTSIIGKIGAHPSYSPEWYLFTARKLKNVPLSMQFELPFIDEGKEQDIPEDVLLAVHSLAPGTCVGLGVSSPKQNIIAVALHTIRPDLEYHCLGAALFNLEIDAGKFGNATNLSGSGFEWLRFLFTTPRRTWAKIVIILMEVFQVVLIPSSQQKFKKFVVICEPSMRKTSR